MEAEDFDPYTLRFPDPAVERDFAAQWHGSWRQFDMGWSLLQLFSAVGYFLRVCRPLSPAEAALLLGPPLLRVLLFVLASCWSLHPAQYGKARRLLVALARLHRIVICSSLWRRLSPGSDAGFRTLMSDVYGGLALSSVVNCSLFTDHVVLQSLLVVQKLGEVLSAGGLCGTMAAAAAATAAAGGQQCGATLVTTGVGRRLQQEGLLARTVELMFELAGSGALLVGPSGVRPPRDPCRAHLAFACVVMDGMLPTAAFYWREAATRRAFLQRRRSAAPAPVCSDVAAALHGAVTLCLALVLTRLVASVLL